MQAFWAIYMKNKTYVKELSSQTDDNEQQKVEGGFVGKNG